jgi:phage replication O-like protein O
MRSKKLRLEREFLQAPNALFENLARTYRSPNESKILSFIIRKTFGWHKESDWIDLSQIVEGTGIAKSNVCRSLNSLKRRNIIKRPDSRHVGLQLDYSMWLHIKNVTVT